MTFRRPGSYDILIVSAAVAPGGLIALPEIQVAAGTWLMATPTTV